jgi:hypothetical protein
MKHLRHRVSIDAAEPHAKYIPSFASNGVGESPYLGVALGRYCEVAALLAPHFIVFVLDLRRADFKHELRRPFPAGDIDCVAHVHPLAQSCAFVELGLGGLGLEPETFKTVYNSNLDSGQLKSRWETAYTASQNGNISRRTLGLASLDSILSYL